MKAISRIAAVIVPLFLTLASVHAQSTYNRETRPLYAGQHYLVGQLVVEQYGGPEAATRYLRVTYNTRSSGAVMTATHLYVGTKPPTKSAPGQFPYKRNHNPGVLVDQYDIPLNGLTGTICIAAHADTCLPSVIPDWETTLASIPASPTPTVVRKNLNTAYMTIEPAGFPPFLAWCVNRSIALLYDVPLPTIYELAILPDGTVNDSIFGVMGPRSLDHGTSIVPMLSYLLNRPYVAQVGQGGPYNWAEVQIAIWHLTNGTPVDLAPAVADPVNVLAIVTDVLANGPGFLPQPGQLLAVIVDPQMPVDVLGNVKHYQPLIIGVPFHSTPGSGGCETAWAAGTVRFRTGWGSYFAYDLIP